MQKNRPAIAARSWRTVITGSAALLLLSALLSAAQSMPPPVPPAASAPARPSPFQPPEPLDFGDHKGWLSLFDGQSLTGWDGNPAVWRVADGAIVATSTAERRVGSTHLIWTGGSLADFELKLELKLDGDIHSGIAYRSDVQVNRPGATAAGRGAAGAGRAAASSPARAGGGPGRGGAALAVPVDPRWTLYGPGFDFDADLQMAGNVEDRGTPRREVAWRGGMVRAEAGQRPRLIGNVGDAGALLAMIKPGDWNQVHIIVRGHQFTHIINGHVMAVLIDDDAAYYRASGSIGLQIESYGTGQVNVRNIWLKRP